MPPSSICFHREFILRLTASNTKFALYVFIFLQQVLCIQNMTLFLFAHFSCPHDNQTKLSHHWCSDDALLKLASFYRVYGILYVQWKLEISVQLLGWYHEVPRFIYLLSWCTGIGESDRFSHFILFLEQYLWIRRLKVEDTSIQGKK